MSTFDIKEYIAQVAENVLSQQPDYDFQLTEVSGLGGLEGIISGQVAYDNFIATDSTGDGYVYQQPNGGYFMRRVATVFIMRKYPYMDMAAMREEVEKCRRYFNLIAAQMVADQPDLETKLIYLNTERIVIREFEPETSGHFTGLYFMLEFSQPYSLVAAPPVPPTPEPAYIKGHIVDGARTFTFKVNVNETITVDVDEQGNWKWEVDRTITSLSYAFFGYTSYKLRTIEIVGLDLSLIRGFGMVIGADGDFSTADPVLTFDMSKCKGELSIDISYALYRIRNNWIMPNISGSIKNLTAVTLPIAYGYLKGDLYFGNLTLITYEALINLIQKVKANITITLQAGIYRYCSEGGIWHADVQAALDAKAAEGFTVTLISA